MKKIINTDKAPAAIGPYSQAIVAGNFIYTAGQIPLDPKTGALKNASIEDETTQALNNLKAILEAAGTNLQNAIKLSIFITNMNDFAKINEIYASYFEKDNYPAREVIQVSALPKGSNIEISAVALIEK